MFLYQRNDFVYVSDIPQFVLYKWTFSTTSNVQIPPGILLFSLDSSISQVYLHFGRENTVMSMETNQIAKHAADIMRHSNLFQLCDIVTSTCLALFLILPPKIIQVFNLRAFNVKHIIWTKQVRQRDWARLSA